MFNVYVHVMCIVETVFLSQYINNQFQYINNIKFERVSKFLKY